MSALTLPGEIPGLLRRGSPVIALGQPAVVLGPDDRPEDERHGEWLVMACSGEWDPPVYADCDVEFMPLSRTAAEMTLDLADATGRAHAAWWLSCVGASFRVYNEHGGVVLSLGEPGDREWGAPACFFIPGATVPALADLDPEDPRLLPDGSRWVDAEALRLVCLHVWGEMQAKGGQ